MNAGEKNNLYDVVIVGGGPAGLSAAIYMARAKYRVLVMEKNTIGGQIRITSEVVNYPGIERTSGKALTDAMKKQAEAFGAEFAIGEVMDMELSGEIKVLHTTKGEYRALGVILATGANPRKLGFKGEKEFQGRGVAYCATCDGEFFTGMDVYVIGGGFAAVEEGIFLTRYAKKVTMIVREDDFTCAKTVSDGIKKQPGMEVKFNSEIMEVGGEHMVSYARFRNNKTGEEWERDAGKDGGFGVFVFAGYVPNTAWLEKDIERNPQGYIVTDRNQKTSLDGVYAAGDMCIKDLRQVVTSVADGASAATSLEKYVAELHHRLDIPELYVKKEKAEGAAEEKAEAAGSGENRDSRADDETGVFISKEIRAQLEGVFSKFQGKVLVKAFLDDSPLSGEVGNFIGELDGLTDKVSCEKIQVKESEKEGKRILPSIELYHEDGRDSGIRFHGVPGGHEFNSFIIALYNVAGPGQTVEVETAKRLSELDKDINVKVMISLSCTMCPEVVMATQKAASLSSHVTAEMLDLMHFPELKEKYKIMSVPCMVVNDEKVYFGKKNMEEITEILTAAS